MTREDQPEGNKSKTGATDWSIQYTFQYCPGFMADNGPITGLSYKDTQRQRLMNYEEVDNMTWNRLAQEILDELSENRGDDSVKVRVLGRGDELYAVRSVSNGALIIELIEDGRYEV